MDTSPGHVAALKLEGHIRHFRGMAAVRFAMALGLTAIVAVETDPLYALGFGVLHLALYSVLFWAVEVAARDPDASQALRKLTVRTGLITFLISLQACAMALDVRADATSQVVRLETGLLIIGVLMFTALQVHMSRLGYAAAIAPSIGSMVWISLNAGPAMPSGHFAAAVLLFVVAIVAASWRQQSTDRTLADARLALEEKNLALTAMVARAEAAQAQAEAASRAKSDFLAMTSHEIRTPLNAVLGLAEALTRSRLSTRQKDMARGVVDAGALLKRLLDAMLDIGRIEAGKTTLSPEPFDLRQSVETVFRVWGQRAAEQDVTLVPDLDGLPGSCGLLADGGKVEQVLINLVSNALKFSPRGGQVTLRVAAAAESGDSDLTVRMEVLDQGPGVPAADRERIFRVFEQTTAGRALGGAGLGLAICAGNLALMGGQIEVGDAPGGGAAFRVTFTAPACGLVDDGDVQIEADGLDETRPLRVLAAEDNAGNRHVLRALLEPLPVTLTVVENGQQALTALAAESFDMVLMDANMPVMDGLSALRALRGAGSTIPVWMLTANVYEEDVARYRAAGADGVVRKPIALEELFAALAEAAAHVDAPPATAEAA